MHGGADKSPGSYAELQGYLLLLLRLLCSLYRRNLRIKSWAEPSIKLGVGLLQIPGEDHGFV